MDQLKDNILSIDNIELDPNSDLIFNFELNTNILITISNNDDKLLLIDKIINNFTSKHKFSNLVIYSNPYNYAHFKNKYSTNNFKIEMGYSNNLINDVVFGYNFEGDNLFVYDLCFIHHQDDYSLKTAMNNNKITNIFITHNIETIKSDFYKKIDYIID